MNAKSAFSRIADRRGPIVVEHRIHQPAIIEQCSPRPRRESRFKTGSRSASSVNAAISSRSPGDSGDGPRITPCVNRDRNSVRSGLNAKRCMICGTGRPAARSCAIRTAEGPFGSACSTSGSNIGSIRGL